MWFVGDVIQFLMFLMQVCLRGSSWQQPGQHLVDTGLHQVCSAIPENHF